MPQPASDAHVQSEISAGTMLRRLVAIALPMVVSQASETVMLFVDRLFLSRVSQLHLAAAMSGGLTSFAVASIFIGTAAYVNAIVAQYYGAGQHRMCARATAQAVYFALAAAPVLAILSIFVPSFFELMRHDPGQVPLESIYARWLMAGGGLLLVRHALTGFFLGTGRTRVVMIATIAGMIVNVPLNYLLIFGAFGFPELGMAGAAIGTLGGSLTSLAVLLGSYLSRTANHGYSTRSSWRLDRTILSRLLRFGSPAGIEMFLNVFAFNLFVQLMHGYGASVAAAVTIAFNWDIVAFIPMLGAGAATTAVVGQYVGADSVRDARRATIMALRLAWTYSGTMMLLFFVGAGPLVYVFSAGFPDATAVAPLARTLLRLVGFYTVADATQLILAGALRGAGDTRWVMRMNVILHWAFAGIAVLLIQVLEAAPIAVWICFIGFVLSMSVAMFLRFRSGRWESMRVI